MNKLFFLFSCLLTTLPAFSQKTYHLADAIHEKLISVRTVASGGHTGQSLILYIDRLTKKNIDILIPAGQRFAPADSTLQSLINVKEEILALDQPKKMKRIYGFCTEATDGSPGADAKFAVDEMAAGALLKVVGYISENKLHQNPDVQAAIWSVTNQYPVASIGHRGLLEVTCQALNLPVPEYRIVQGVPPAPIPGAPAIHFEPLRIEGKFEYTSDEPRTLNVYLLDASGQRLRTLIPDRPHPRGITRFTFKFETTKLETGKYRVCLEDGVKVVKCIDIDYKATP